MRVDVGARRSGKTTRIIGSFLQDPFNSVIVCFNQEERARVQGLLSPFGFSREVLEARVMCPSPSKVFRENLLGSPDTNVYLDNADAILRQMFGNVVHLSMMP